MLKYRSETPLFIYNERIISAQYQEIEEALGVVTNDFKIAYCYKTNPFLARYLGKLTDYFLISSENHLKDFQSVVGKEHTKTILFYQPGASPKTIRLAAERGTIIIVDSFHQLQILNEFFACSTKRAQVMIRVEIPGFSNSSNFAGSGLGEPIDSLVAIIEKIKNLKDVKLCGIHTYIGSQTTDLNTWEKYFKHFVEVFEKIGIELDYIDIGGGFPINYREVAPSIKQILKVISDPLQSILDHANGKLLIEPGRYLAGPAGILLAKIVDIKSDYNPRTVFIDASTYTCSLDTLIADIRLPCLAVSYREDAEELSYIVRGNAPCYLDNFGMYQLPKVKKGDLIAFYQAGAYTASLRTNFAGLSKPKEIILKNWEDSNVTKKTK